jgi:ectoine hydroxylase-related dioxygenase (phytanoyl-CoA dioxygenase family)
MTSFALTDGQREHFRTEGYVVVESVFDRRDLVKIDAAIAEMASAALQPGADMSRVLELEPEQVDGRPVVRRLYDPYDQHAAFQALATDPRLLDKIESLIGADFNLQHSKLNMKPARAGSAVEWHQDLAYFPHTNDDLVTTLIYLDNASEENGCLQVLPRHHHHFFSHTQADGTFAGKITEDLNSGRFGLPQPLAAPAGSVIFMHCILPHCSLPNRSNKPRRTLIFEYRANDSLPIYFGPMTHDEEARYRPIRGQRAAFARFGGPPPLIPLVRERYSSLYELQQRTK